MRAVNLHVSGKFVTPAEALLAAGMGTSMGFLSSVGTNMTSLLREREEGQAAMGNNGVSSWLFGTISPLERVQAFLAMHLDRKCRHRLKTLAETDRSSSSQKRWPVHNVDAPSGERNVTYSML